MQEFLTFQLYAPLQAYGSVAVGEIRSSRTMPTRSAIMGLVAAALGITRDNEELLRALHAAFSVTCCRHTTPSVMVDYHTVQTPVQRKGRIFYSRKDELEQKLEPAEKLNTILSRREYLEQAYYTVALAYKEQGASSWTFQKIAAALRAPMFTLYLGRKSCPPALPLAPLVIECESALEALGSYSLPEDIVCGLSFDKDVLISSDQPFEGATEYLARDVPNYEGRAWKDGGRRLFDDRKEYQGIVSNFSQCDKRSGEEVACI